MTAEEAALIYEVIVVTIRLRLAREWLWAEPESLAAKAAGTNNQREWEDRVTELLRATDKARAERKAKR